MATPQQQNGTRTLGFLYAFVVLLALLGLLFAKSLGPENVVFSNDGPLGAMAAKQNQVPAVLAGGWQDLNWIGTAFPAAPPTISTAIRVLTSPLVFSKIYAPTTLFILGICAWFFFRQLKLTPLACALGALATVLNSGPFSIAAWGVAAQCIMVGMMFVALGLIVRNHSSRPWLNAALAGMAVGMGVMEGFDLGALFSLLVAAFVMFHTLTGQGPLAKKAGMGVLRVTVVAVCAGFLATHALTSLVSTQIKGVGGMQQDDTTRAARWDEATQWSLPKREALGLFVPGLFGYRMDTPKDIAMLEGAYEGGVYWGAVGRHAIWDRYFADGAKGPPPPPGMLRFSGGNGYAGVLVVLVAVWALLQSLRKQDSVFTLDERKFVWFWGVTMIGSLLLAFGRYAPFYGILYQLPYFSTIRNPAKFALIWDFATLIVFTVGINALIRRYMAAPAAGSGSFGAWWRKAGTFDRRWVFGTFLAFAVAVIGWVIYAMSKDALAQYLGTVGIPSDMVQTVAWFSVKEVGWFVLFLAASAALVALALSGKFAGRRARLGGVLLGVVLVVDLARADLPWIVYWNYPEKYATNPIIEILRDKPFEHRVASIPDWFPRIFQMPPDYQRWHSHFDQLYGLEWAQHHFHYYNIQSLDLVQMPRMPQDLMAYRAALSLSSAETLHLPVREWELTNTRYLLGTAAFMDVLNQALDSGRGRFRIVETFEVEPKPGVLDPEGYEELTAVTATNGRWALMEFTGALPRARLYGTWHVSTNDPALLQQWTSNMQQRLPEDFSAAIANRDLVDIATLHELTRPDFDPHQTLLLAPPPASVPASGTNANTGTVEYRSYEPKRIVLHASAAVPSVLLLNDRYDPNWKVTVNGQPSELLRCNFIMRGVYLTPGEHTIEFRFEPPIWPLYVSVIAIFIALGLVGTAVALERRSQTRT